MALLDGLRGVSTSTDGTLRVLNLENGQTLKTLKGQTSEVKTVALLGNCRIVSGSTDGTLRVWDLESGEALAVTTLDAPVWAVATSPDGKIIVAGDKLGRIHFFDLVEPEYGR